MTNTKLTRIELQNRVAKALGKIEALEHAYETITIGELVSRRARTHGSTMAINVFDRGERATYAEMDCCSNNYANALRAFGVRKGDRVLVMLPNRIEFPILWFAFAKLGAVMVPTSMHHTPVELEYVLTHTQARFTVLDESVWPMFSAMEPWSQEFLKEQVLLVGESADAQIATIDELLKGVDDSPVDEDVCADDLLTINYTSGTTGFPKGCMLTHDRWGIGSYQAASLDYEPYKRYLSAGPFFYSEPQAHLLKSYRQGGTLYLAPELSASRFIDWLKQHRIDWCSFPEVVARQAESDDIEGSTSLKQTLIWGWSPDSVRRFRERFRVRTQDAFGMTEIGRGTQMPNELDVMADSGSVGLRAPFRHLRLFNDDGSPTPVDEVGELWVRGRGIFKGYWNNPQANAAAFEGEWFKTGDLLRRDELGFYWLVGRKKDVIRRSGENIAAREVEAIICELPEIADVAAVPVGDAKRGEEVKIYVELKEGVTPADLPVECILEHAIARLAAFKVPRYIAFIPSLPRADTKARVLKRELTAISDPVSGCYDSEKKRWR
ncbi:acyl--CoA ligase [Bradyrhizobium sp. 4]|uniref:class I adenylate-forming enzyme family protein n=1 Tax=unclassified Bradyrhizobium TaxID=2631580 RepID=UPI001FF8E2E8|nr:MULTISPECIES: class I adenylate-forming enzyme family protein [unclassified Bradyrhizobium]MCK1403675.1 acyl--CoA ligase [Bradyrhizobium sp. 39]MCK1634620.1 acyl--CoA ligase [Bradyrhizobium sp. 162]MCK1751412.1 acyl--CoA ligase [Bradyrhizobium sp. 135]UPJ36432.1 acyl--CoA ligase [Bradyrhizobium sp. 4]